MDILQEEEAGRCSKLTHLLAGKRGGVGKRPHLVESGV